MRRFLLAIAYFGLLTPIALVLRIFSDPLNRRWSPGEDSYWRMRK